jgi:hypothetical protein
VAHECEICGQECYKELRSKEITLQDAAEKLVIIRNRTDFDDCPSELMALQLGIEALKEIQRARLNGYRFVAVRLPGETEE